MLGTGTQPWGLQCFYPNGYLDLSLFIPLLHLSFSPGKLGTVLSTRQEVPRRNGLEVVTDHGSSWHPKVFAGMAESWVMTLPLISLWVLLGNVVERRRYWHFAPGGILIKDKHIPRCREVEVTWMLSDFLASKISLFHVSPKKKNNKHFYLLQYRE